MSGLLTSIACAGDVVAGDFVLWPSDAPHPRAVIDARWADSSRTLRRLTFFGGQELVVHKDETVLVHREARP